MSDRTVTDLERPPLSRHAGPWVMVCVVAGVAAGWAWLATVVGAMLAGSDPALIGPGMEIFAYRFSVNGLPPEIHAALAALCLPGAGHFGMPGEGRWGPGDLALVAAMWQAMVLAMMLPSAAPALTLLARRSGRTSPAAAVRLVAGYLVIWSGFALAATLAQWALTAARALTPAMAPASLILSGTTLIAVGLYQFTPLKRACLIRCRTPVEDAGDTGVTGGFRDGLQAGRDCLGCCAALMVAMFAVGVMNVAWIVLLGAMMLLEKRGTGYAPTWAIGIGMIAWGLGLVAASPAGRHLAGLG